MVLYIKQVLQTCEKQLDWAPAETPTKIAGLGNSRNIFGKIAELGTSRNTSGNIAGTISFILWENCRGFAPAIFRGTLGNWDIHNFRN